MPHPTPIRLLPTAGRLDRSAYLHLRLVRGSSGCRGLTTAEALAEIGGAPATASEQALAFLSAAVDRAIAQEIAA